MFVEIPILSDWIEYPINKVLSGGSSSWRIKFFMISKDFYALQHRSHKYLIKRSDRFFQENIF